jgi:hypothetical protein
MNLTSNNSTDIKEMILVTGYIDFSIEIFGIVTNIMNAFIFSRKDFKDGIFAYFYIHSLSIIIYNGFNIFGIIEDCGPPNIRESYFSKWLTLYNKKFFTSSLAIFSIFLELTISLHRYLTVTNSSCCSIIKNKSPFLVSSILFIISFLYYLPVVFFSEIVRIDKSNYYSIAESKIAKKNQTLILYYSVMINLFRGPIFLSILATINLLTLRKFRNQMIKKRSMLTKSHRFVGKINFHSLLKNIQTKIYYK